MYVHCFQNPTSTKETSFGAYSDAPFPNHNRNAPTVSFYKNKEHVSFIQSIYYYINNIKPRWFFLLRFFQKLVFHLSIPYKKHSKNAKVVKKFQWEVGAIAITNKPLFMENFGYGYSTEGLFVMAVALTLHWNFMTTLEFLEYFYMVLLNKKQVLKESKDFFFTLASYR